MACDRGGPRKAEAVLEDACQLTPPTSSLSDACCCLSVKGEEGGLQAAWTLGCSADDGI